MRNGFVPLWILAITLLVLLFAPIPFRYETTAICAQPLVYSPGKYKPCPQEGDIGWGPSVAKRIWWLITQPEAEPTEEKKLPENAEGKVCGGFAGEKDEWACPEGYRCVYPKPRHPDEPGKCTKMGFIEELRWNNP